jgi:ABC-type transport system involved in multi-copper enzyme maturation permease subunit
MTFPSAAACYALGGAGSQGGITALYGILAIAAVQLSTLALMVSCNARSIDSALRVTYSLVLVVCVLTLVPYGLMRGQSDPMTEVASWLRCLSPIPAVMEVLGQGDVGAHGMSAGVSVVGRYVLLASAFSLICAMSTILRLNHRLFDRARAAGIMTQDRSAEARVARSLWFLFFFDPQRRSGNMSVWVNPVMVKEFRSRRFGRLHWLMRLVAVCAILSLGLSYIAASGALGWGVEIIGGALVLLQIVLLILFAPSLAAGLVSTERETGTWQLLRMTPLSAGSILLGKLLSVGWPLLLLLCATLPGYVAMVTVRPAMALQVQRVVACLVLTAVFAVLVSAAASTLFRSTAAATTASYLALLGICVGPLLVWLAREAPFGHATVQAALTVDPVAAALQASDTPGFVSYELLPANWCIIGAACIMLLLFLSLRTWQLYRPE